MFDKFKALREKGYTLEAIARATGHSVSTIARWNQALKEGKTVRVAGDKTAYTIPAEQLA